MAGYAAGLGGLQNLFAAQQAAQARHEQQQWEHDQLAAQLAAQKKQSVIGAVGNVVNAISQNSAQKQANRQEIENGFEEARQAAQQAKNEALKNNGGDLQGAGDEAERVYNAHIAMLKQRSDQYHFNWDEIAARHPDYLLPTGKVTNLKKKPLPATPVAPTSASVPLTPPIAPSAQPTDTNSPVQDATPASVTNLTDPMHQMTTPPQQKVNVSSDTHAAVMSGLSELVQQQKAQVPPAQETMAGQNPAVQPTSNVSPAVQQQIMQELPTLQQSQAQAPPAAPAPAMPDAETVTDQSAPSEEVDPYEGKPLAIRQILESLHRGTPGLSPQDVQKQTLLTLKGENAIRLQKVKSYIDNPDLDPRMKTLLSKLTMAAYSHYKSNQLGDNASQAEAILKSELDNAESVTGLSINTNPFEGMNLENSADYNLKKARVGEIGKRGDLIESQTKGQDIKNEHLGDLMDSQIDANKALAKTRPLLAAVAKDNANTHRLMYELQAKGLDENTAIKRAYLEIAANKHPQIKDDPDIAALDKTISARQKQLKSMGHLNQNFVLVANENTPESPNNVENFKWVQKEIEKSTDLQARLAEGLLSSNVTRNPTKKGVPQTAGSPLTRTWAKPK